MPERSSSSDLRGIGPFLNLGLTFALGIVLLAGLGYMLDKRWDTAPWLTLGGAVLGVVVGFVNLFRTALPRKEGR